MYEEHQKEITGYMPETTNNRMELYAVIQALGQLKRSCKVSVYSDSAYLVNASLQGWLQNWQNNGWKTANKQPVENQDLWKSLLSLMEPHEVNFVKVRGHSDNEWNKRCDRLATAQIKQHSAANQKV